MPGPARCDGKRKSRRVAILRAHRTKSWIVGAFSALLVFCGFIEMDLRFGGRVPEAAAAVNEFVAPLLEGRNTPGETRRRRVGERLWTLAMIEAWMRVFIDGGGKRPSGSFG